MISNWITNNWFKYFNGGDWFLEIKHKIRQPSAVDCEACKLEENLTTDF